MNKVILLGRLTRDPESRTSASNLEVTRFSVACNSDNFSRNSENQAEFINCVAFGNTANAINRFFKKGSQISLIGRIQNSNYTGQDGIKRYNTNVVVDSFEFCGPRQNGETNDSYVPSNESNNSFTSNDESSFQADPYKDFGDDLTISGDDLPF